tara:strand:+ start:162 stop:422 length:261 start_codon:yes stop_codon:yes gene_type:complete
MSRKIVINKYEGNTHYNVSVFDSYGIEHHLGYKGQGELHELGMSIIESRAEEIWQNEVKPKKDLLGDAIAECIKMDKERGVEPNLD